MFEILRKTLSKATQKSPWQSFLNDLDTKAKMSDREVMDRFVKALSQANSDWRDEGENTLLMHMAIRGKKAIVKRLIHELYADVNAVNKDGDTALHKAAIFGSKEICDEILKSSGMIILKKNKNGDTATQLAQINHHKELSDFLKQHEKRVAVFRSGAAHSDQR